MLFVAEGYVPAAELGNPFRDLLSSCARPSEQAAREAGQCRCGGVYEFCPRTQAYVCAGSRRYRRGADGTYVEFDAPSCGGVEPGLVIQEPERASDSASNLYDPVHHLNTWLLRLGSNEDAAIDPYFLRLVRGELERVGTVPADATYEDVVEAMERITEERINCRSMYEHRMLIFNLIRGRPPLHISHEESEAIRAYFRQFTRAYRELPGHLLVGRRSFIEYSFTIYMICLILGYDHILPWLPLVRSPHIIEEYNAIFSEVCRRLRWPQATLSRSSIWHG